MIEQCLTHLASLFVRQLVVLICTSLSAVFVTLAWYWLKGKKQ